MDAATQLALGSIQGKQERYLIAAVNCELLEHRCTTTLLRMLLDQERLPKPSS